MSEHVVLWPYGKTGRGCAGMLGAFGDDGVSGRWRKLLHEYSVMCRFFFPD